MNAIVRTPGSPTAIVVEDEAPQREELLAMLTKAWPALRIVETCTDGLHAIDAISEHQPDIVFVDIRIPGISGLEVARHASATTAAMIVFTTAYDHYAVEAFNQQAIDYLLKPINTERLEECIRRLQARLGLPTGERHLKQQADRQALTDLQPSNPVPLKWIMTNLAGTIKMVPIDEVLFFQSQDKYTRVVTANIDTHIRTPLKELAQGLDPSNYWVVHRSVIVRVEAIDRVTRDDSGKMFVFIRGRKESLPVSLAYQHRFRVM
jgi:DNA-binding LytR/AlgR family response regulator